MTSPRPDTVTSMEDRVYTVMVPILETRHGTRTVCRSEPVTTYREVTCDQGACVVVEP